MYLSTPHSHSKTKTFEGMLDATVVKLVVLVLHKDIGPEIRRLLDRGHGCRVEHDSVLFVALLATLLLFNDSPNHKLSSLRTFPSSSKAHLPFIPCMIRYHHFARVSVTPPPFQRPVFPLSFLYTYRDTQYSRSTLLSSSDNT